MILFHQDYKKKGFHLGSFLSSKLKIENLMLKDLFLRCCQIPNPKSDSENSRTGMTYPLLIQKSIEFVFLFLTTIPFLLL